MYYIIQFFNIFQKNNEINFSNGLNTLLIIIYTFCLPFIKINFKFIYLTNKLKDLRQSGVYRKLLLNICFLILLIYDDPPNVFIN